jgi:hypothetical protein
MNSVKNLQSVFTEFLNKSFSDTESPFKASKLDRMLIFFSYSRSLFHGVLTPLASVQAITVTYREGRRKVSVQSQTLYPVPPGLSSYLAGKIVIWAGDADTVFVHRQFIFILRLTMQQIQETTRHMPQVTDSSNTLGRYAKKRRYWSFSQSNGFTKWGGYL